MFNDLFSSKEILSLIQSVAFAIEYEKRQNDALIDESIFNLARTQFLINLDSTFVVSPTLITLKIDLNDKLYLEVVESCNKACIKIISRTSSTKTLVSKRSQSLSTTSKIITIFSLKSTS